MAQSHSQCEGGPAAVVIVWTDEKLQGMSMRLLTDSEYPRLPEALDSQIESMEIGCATAGPRAGAAGVLFRAR